MSRMIGWRRVQEFVWGKKKKDFSRIYIIYYIGWCVCGKDGCGEQKMNCGDKDLHIFFCESHQTVTSGYILGRKKIRKKKVKLLNLLLYICILGVTRWYCDG